MRNAPRHGRALLFGAVVLVAAGCGGGGDASLESTPATPGATTPGSTVADPNAPAPAAGTPATPGTTDPAAIDPATGLPMAAPEETGPELPDLDGEDLSDGTDTVAGDAFGPRAIPVDDANQANDAVDLGTPDMSTIMDGFQNMPKEPTTATTATKRYGGAKIYVDGKTYEVLRGKTFPKGDPVFRLVSITPTEIEIELVAGEFTSDGSSGLFLDRGDLVSLVNASEGGIAYKVKFLRAIAPTTGSVTL